MKRQKEIVQTLISKSIPYNTIRPNEGGFAIEISLSKDEFFSVIASWGKNWDHVSVKVCNMSGGRIPTWNEMCFIKGIFWRPSEWVVQYHPAEADYKNCHPNVLHLWKPQRGEIIRPPRDLV